MIDIFTGMIFCISKSTTSWYIGTWRFYSAYWVTCHIMNSIVQSVLDISSYFPWLVIILSFQQMHHYCYHKYLCKSHKETTRMTGERVAILLLLHLVNHSTKKVYHHHYHYEPYYHHQYHWRQ